MGFYVELMGLLLLPLIVVAVVVALAWLGFVVDPPANWKAPTVILTPLRSHLIKHLTQLYASDGSFLTPAALVSGTRCASA